MAADATARLKTLKRMIMAIGGVAAFAIFILLTTPAWRDHQDAALELRRDAEMQARILAAQVDASLRAVNATLLAAGVELTQRPAATPINPMAMNETLLAPLAQRRDARALILIGPDGALTADSEDASPPAIDLSDRGYVRVLKEGFDKGQRGPVIDGPFIGRSSGKAIIVLARSVGGSDGAMAGILAAILDPNQLRPRYEALTSAPDADIRLHYLDGGLLLRAPERGVAQQQEMVARILLAQAGPSGSDLVSRPDLPAVAVAYARLTEQPLAVVVSLPAEEALRAAQRKLNQDFGLAIAAGLIAAGLIAALIRQIRRAERAQECALRNERELATASSALETALSHMRLGLVLVDGDLRVTVCNQRYLDLFGLSPDAAQCGQPLTALLADLQRLSGDGADAAGEPVRLLADMTPDAAPIEGVVTLADGRILQCCTAPLPGGGGAVTFADVTDAHRAAVHLAQAKERAELADQAKTRLLANVSHELRTPLNAIIGFSEGLAGGYFGPVPDGHRDYLDAIVRSGRHLHALIDDLLDVARIESGGLELKIETVALRPAVEEVLSMLSDRAAKSNVTLIDAVAADEPPLECDRRALRQMLLNLVNNGVKFTPAGGSVTVRLEQRPQGARVLAVADTGVGIPPEAHDLILRPFSQSEVLSRRQEQGVGLGLPIVKGLIEAHGGRLELQSAAGAGATVRLVFPSDPAPQSETPSAMMAVIV